LKYQKIVIANSMRKRVKVVSQRSTLASLNYSTLHFCWTWWFNPHTL